MLADASLLSVSIIYSVRVHRHAPQDSEGTYRPVFMELLSLTLHTVSAFLFVFAFEFMLVFAAEHSLLIKVQKPEESPNPTDA